MVSKQTKWYFKEVVKMTVATLLNNFDCFQVIEGGTGIGKSTLAIDLARGVSAEFGKLYNLDENLVEYYYERVGKRQGMSPEEFITKILTLKEKEAYRFHPKKDLIYSQTAMQQGLASWNRIIVPDEMINVTFNRDFYSSAQKDIIKMINMFRDHCNLIIACVPSFATLDTQIRGLCKIKFTVKKRGWAMVHTPNSVVYSKDKWDSATNEKIEREWIVKKISRPNYSKLTTYRGSIRFPKLSKAWEIKYQKIKDEKRAVVLKDEMKVEMQEKKDPLQLIYERLIKGGIRSSHALEGVAFALGMTHDALRSKLKKMLEKDGRSINVAQYYSSKGIKGIPNIATSIEV